MEMKRTKREEKEAAWEGRRYSERNARIGMLREDARIWPRGEREREIVREEKSRSARGAREWVDTTDLWEWRSEETWFNACIAAFLLSFGTSSFSEMAEACLKILCFKRTTGTECRKSLKGELLDFVFLFDYFVFYSSATRPTWTSWVHRWKWATVFWWKGWAERSRLSVCMYLYAYLFQAS
jgi:hypothetical protein